MDRHVAEQIIPILKRALSEVESTIHVYKQQQPSDGQLKAYTNAVGDVFLAVDALMRPIISEHPDLHP